MATLFEDFMTIMKKLLLGLGFFMAVLLILQWAWFAWVLSLPAAPLQADMLAVYGGLPERYQAGWSLEKAGNFKYLVFSDASIESLADMTLHFGPARHAKVLLEPSARTTVDNARFVARLILRYHCRTALIVTSWWHLPRALFLTHLALLGKNVQVDGIASDAGPEHTWNSKNLWGETIRFWGSLFSFP
jgi:uncharacterized SAM-binding protein YcdF (DUF218 family)